MALHDQLSQLNRDVRRARSLANSLHEHITGESQPDGVEASSTIDGALALQVDALVGPVQDVIALLQVMLERLGPDEVTNIEADYVRAPIGGLLRNTGVNLV